MARLDIKQDSDFQIFAMEEQVFYI